MPLLRIGTRRSMLAMAQTRLVADAIRRDRPDVEVEYVRIVTTGDRNLGPLAPDGGKGLFTAELEAALRDGGIDLAVHSAKDMPATMDDDFVIAAVPPREDPADALVSPAGGEIASLPGGAIVGTSSLRRRAQLAAMRSDLQFVPLRGNVDTRMRKCLAPQDDSEGARMDAVVVAMAGLKRSGLLQASAAHVRPLAIEQMIPAAGQAALALQCLVGNDSVRELLSSLDDSPSHRALTAERFVVHALAASCHSCLAVHVRTQATHWQALAMAARPDGAGMIRCGGEGSSPAEAAESLLKSLRSLGAGELLSLD